MTKKLIIYFAAIVFTLLACRNEENLTSSSRFEKINESNFNSKSLWKENKQLIIDFSNHFNQSFIPDKKSENEYYDKNGIPLWEYAFTYENVEDRLKRIDVPLIKNNRIVGVLYSEVKNGKIKYFTTNDVSAISFFSKLVNPILEKTTVIKDFIENNHASKLIYECTRHQRTFIVGPANGAADSDITSTETYYTCEYVWNPDEVKNEIDPCPIGSLCGGSEIGGGDGIGDTNDEKDPCEKIKSNLQNTKFKDKFSNLSKQEIFNLSHEKGAFERYPPKENTSIQPSFADIENKIGTTNMDLPDNVRGIIGLMHSHNNEDSNGNHPIKIFSPTDVRTFLNILMPQAGSYTGSYTNAYSVVTTSGGNYMLKYTKETWPGSINYDTKENWQTWYEDNYRNLLDDDLMTQENVEKLFTQFLKEVVKIDGLEVYKVTETTSEKLEYNGKNQPIKSTQCP